MKKLKKWQRWGLYAVGARLAIDLFTYALDRIHWYYQETIWYYALAFVDAPPGRIERAFLNWLQVPRLYDVPLTWREALIIYSSWIFLGYLWWFLLGAAAALIWTWFARRRTGTAGRHGQ